MLREKNTMVVNGSSVACDAEYGRWIEGVKQDYRSAQFRGAVKVNVEKLRWNWSLGRDLVTRKAEEKWGAGIVEQVSLDLRNEFPGERGFGVDNIWLMKRWFEFYQGHEAILETLSQEFGLSEAIDDFPSCFGLASWGQHVEIIKNCGTVEEALFYIRLVVKEGLSCRALARSIKANEYETHGRAITNFSDRLPAAEARLAQEITKENYDFSFITLPKDYDEHALEDALEAQISLFLLQLGNGFAFIGRQKEIVVDGVSRRIDMLFYHIRLRCYVVIELKVCRFEPEFAGKLNFYVDAVDELLKAKDDNPTIGLLICSDMRDTEVRWSFKGLSTPIGVATYDNVQLAAVETLLPSADDIKKRIEVVRAEIETIAKNQGPIERSTAEGK